ncbi:binding-protein-dependent transport systems inner membrane component [Thermobaculum terrenum ATCC BAA-798]|uniref:Binding-protein-dependent transport systems inner membrane component n=1 Tax=Thermobaculum terrenum (strain ATCC BAA-798 / CCMEE 7001 / YNP1) TaxID=525904 RepID=D1CEG4_THET1|nr:sugar ABC transporter permease [Thermobaculum terrenum]ACZ41320.1 binding-protein-dependent transport systems inner membrane component [Thermobaculum terrenum ATCC BAA-798]
MAQQIRLARARQEKSSQENSALARRQARVAWLFLIPTLLVVAIVAAWPMIQVVWLSLTNAQLLSPTPPKFIGLDNYVRLIHDSIWWHTVWNTVLFTVITVTFEFVLGMVIALVVNSQFKARGFMRAAMLVPWAIPTVVSAMMWKWMYNDIYGVINDLLVNKLHILDHNVAFLAVPSLAIPSVAAIDIWKTTPFVALLLLAGLQVIPNDIYEAATVDGATAWQRFFQITLPLLRPAIAVTLIFRTLDALRVFDVFYVMFGNDQSRMPMAVYVQNYLVQFQDVGYSSAISMFIFMIIGIFVVAYVTTLGVEVEQ